jgi:hypothetical protein
MFSLLLPFIIELFDLLEIMLREPNRPNPSKKPTRTKNKKRIEFGI